MEKEDNSFNGDYYHIYNRGVSRESIFIDNNDRERFMCSLFVLNNKNNAGNILWRLELKNEINFKNICRFLEENNIKKEPLVFILAYCLKDNHFHLLVKEVEEGGIVKFMHKLNGGYARYFNNRRERRGVFFEGRYREKRVDSDDYLLYLLAYINVINPLQEIFPDIKKKGVDDLSKALKFIKKFKWSSHKDYFNKKRHSLVEKDIFDDIFDKKEDYLMFIEDVLGYKRDVWEAEHLFLE